MEIIPLTPAQIEYRDKKPMPKPKLVAGSLSTIPNRVMTHLDCYGPLRFVQLANLELGYKLFHPETIKGDMIPYHYTHLLPHFQDVLSNLQILGYIQKVYIGNIKCYVLA